MHGGALFTDVKQSAQQAQFIIKSIRLQKSTDWTVWLFFIKMIAENDNVWNLIDSDFETKSDYLSKSKKLVYDEGVGDIDLKIYIKWKTKMNLHRTVMTKYEKQRKIFKQLIKQIQFFISADAAVLIANNSSHSYNLFRALKFCFAFFDQAKKIQIEIKYHEFCKKSENQNLEKWLNN